MIPRERVRTSLRHQEPDRVPVDFGSRSSAIEEQVYEQLQAHLGLGEKTKAFLRAHASMSEDVLHFMQVDTRWIRSIPSTSWKDEDAGRLYIDRWNVPWRRAKGNLYYDLEPSSLVSVERAEIEKMQFPELVSDDMLEQMLGQAEWYYKNSDYSIWCDVVGAGIFERAWYLRGFEQFIVEMMVEKSFAHSFLEKILQTQIDAYTKLLDAIGPYIEGVLITDDVAIQDNLLMSKEIYREMIRPYQKRLIDCIHAYDVSIIWHSCGAVYPLIPDFIDMGVRILHPVQTSAAGMDPRRLKQQFGKDLVFWGGGCDIQKVLQSGTVAEVEAEVKQKIAEFAPGGGFVFTTTHCIQPNTPLENISTMVKTYKRFGVYPQHEYLQKDMKTHA